MVYGKYGGKAVASDEWRETREEKGETRKTKLEIREEPEIRKARLENGERRGALGGKS